MRPHSTNEPALRRALTGALGKAGARWALSAALGVAAGAIFLATTRSRTSPDAPPVSDLAEVSDGIDGAESIWVRHLGDGLYELVGHAEDAEAARIVARALAERPGVVAVVNRVFTTTGHAV